MKPIKTPFIEFEFVPQGSILWTFHGDVLTKPEYMNADITESRWSIRLYLN